MLALPKKSEQLYFVNHKSKPATASNLSGAAATMSILDPPGHPECGNAPPGVARGGTVTMKWGGDGLETHHVAHRA